MAGRAAPQGTPEDLAISRALLRDCLEQCHAEALACLWRAEDEPENARDLTGTAAALMRRCLDILESLEKPQVAEGASGTARAGRGERPSKT